MPNNARKNARKYLYNKQNGRCYYCDTDKMFLRETVSKRFYTSNKHNMATFDHIVPDSHGGNYTRTNGVCACSRCNTLRGTLPQEEFMLQYDELYKRLLEKPARVAAKRKLMKWVNSFLIARFACMIELTVEEVFIEYAYHAYVQWSKL